VRLESIRRTYARLRAQGNTASSDRERGMRPIRYASNVLLRFPGPRFKYAIMVQVYPAKTLGSFFSLYSGSMVTNWSDGCVWIAQSSLRVFHRLGDLLWILYRT
jgi:hypothetical protein